MFILYILKIEEIRHLTRFDKKDSILIVTFPYAGKIILWKTEGKLFPQVKRFYKQQFSPLLILFSLFFYLFEYLIFIDIPTIQN